MKGQTRALALNDAHHPATAGHDVLCRTDYPIGEKSMARRLIVYIQLDKNTGKFLVICPACHEEFVNCCSQEPYHCRKCGEIVNEEWSEVE